MRFVVIVDDSTTSTGPLLPQEGALLAIRL